MPKLAGIFSGQGAQYAGMGKELYDSFSYVKEIYTTGSGILGYDLPKQSFSEDGTTLSSTLYAQPAIFALSVAAFTAAKNELGLKIDCVLGHSLGEYAALCCAGAFSLEDGFRVIKARAEAMDKAGNGNSAMYAIMGCAAETVAAACVTAKGHVWPVNFNLPDQTVISGEADATARAAGILSEAGAKTAKLNVSGAFHTKLMQPAAAGLKAAVAGIGFAQTRIPFYSNVTGTVHHIEDYPEYFATHMVSPVRFVEEIHALAADGVTACVEFGPGRVASTLAKKNVKSMTVSRVEDLATLHKLRESLPEFCGQ